MATEDPEDPRLSVHLRRGVLLAIPVSAALFFEFATDSPSKGSIATGALFCGFAGLGWPPRTRALWQAVAAPIIAGVVALGVLTGASSVLAVLTAAVIGPVIGYGFAVSPKLGKAGRPLLAALVIAQGLGLDPADAGRALAYTGAGACLQVICSLAAYGVNRLASRSEVPTRGSAPIAASLVAQLDLRSTALRHSLRLSAALAVSVASYRLLDFGEHGFWVPLTTMFVLAPDPGETFHRLTRRAWGTAIGLGLATVLAELVGADSYALAATMTVAAVVAYATLRIHYAVFSVAITVYAVLLATTLGESALEAGDQRALATALGIAIAAAAFLLWPNPPADSPHPAADPRGGDPGLTT